MSQPMKAPKHVDRTTLLERTPSTWRGTISIAHHANPWSSTTLLRQTPDKSGSHWISHPLPSALRTESSSTSVVDPGSFPHWPTVVIQWHSLPIQQAVWYKDWLASQEEYSIEIASTCDQFGAALESVRLVPFELESLRLRSLDDFVSISLPSERSARTAVPAIGRTSRRYTSASRTYDRVARARKVLAMGRPVLRERSKPVGEIDEKVHHLVADMFKTMWAYKGVGLAANQIGVAQRIAIVDVGDDDPPPLVLINPRIVYASEETAIAEEGCLSIPDIFADVERPDRVTVEALGLDGHLHTYEAAGYKARAIQHEVDHLDGILFIDRLSAVKRSLLLARWKKSGKGRLGEVPEPAGDR